MHTFLTPTWSGVRLGAALAAPVFLLAACGGSGGSTTSGGSGGYGSGAGATGSSASSGSATVETHSGAMGTYLTDGAGHALYLFAADHGGRSACSGACAAAWPPLKTTGPPKAAGGAKAGKLATTSRPDGSKQVTYGGHPLYTFTGDTAAGDTNGEGSSAFGAKWWLVTPNGTALTKSGAGASSPSGGPSSSSGGTGGGWG